MGLETGIHTSCSSSSHMPLEKATTTASTRQRCSHCSVLTSFRAQMHAEQNFIFLILLIFFSVFVLPPRDETDCVANPRQVLIPTACLVLMNVQWTVEVLFAEKSSEQTTEKPTQKETEKPKSKLRKERSRAKAE